jgi:hypothetical protein
MATLQELYNNIVSEAIAQAQWYADKKRPISKASRTIRLCSILLVGLGGLFPLIGAATESNICGYDVTNWGYITIALAGTLIFLDRFFGFSSAWIRYITTEMEIRKQVKEFEMKWRIENYGLDLQNIDPPKAKELLKMLMDFSLLIDEMVKQETNNWATEFQTNIAELQKTINAKVETTTSGAIKVIGNNLQSYKSLRVKIDSLSFVEMTAPTFLLRGVSPGYHLITIRGDANGKEVEVADTVTVEPGKLATIEIKMP